MQKFLLICLRTTARCGPGSSVGIATGYGESPVGGDIFRTCPGWSWGPPSLPYNGYRAFPGGRKRPGRDTDPSPLLVSRSKKQSRPIPLLSLRAFVACENYLPAARYRRSSKRVTVTTLHTNAKSTYRIQLLSM
jgi:hypothetical protein